MLPKRSTVRSRTVPVGLVAGLLLAAPATASTPAGTRPPEPDATSPAGAATLADRFTGARPTVAGPPSVLLGADVLVGPGGAAGEVRVRVPDPTGAPGATVVGPWTTLPAEPGLRRLPAPRVAWSDFTGELAIDQRTGGHRILRTSPCTPEGGAFVDPCRIQRVQVFAPVPPDAGPFGTPSAELPGTALTIAPVTEPDLDGDLRGDRTEEPATPARVATDLRVSGRVQRLRSGLVRLRITVKNRGPATATAPLVELGGVARVGRWAAPCGSTPTTRGTGVTGVRCTLPTLRAGTTRTVFHTLRRSARRTSVTVRVVGDAPNVRRGPGVDRIRLRSR